MTRPHCTRGGTAMHPVSLQKRLRRMVSLCFVPLAAVILLLLVMLFGYTNRYRALLHNVTVASEFNRNFKENIDLVMYYYVVGSRYSTGLPIEEVENAQKLARELIATTTDRNSRKAIQSVLNLSLNLEEKIYRIRDTDNYDDRQVQLEDNIYVLTDLIQEYMYNYLYYEAAQLSTLQADMSARVRAEMALLGCAVALLLLGITYYVRRINRSVTEPISRLCYRAEAIGRGELEPQPVMETPVAEIQALSAGFERMVEQLNALIAQSKQEQVSLRRAELALLQAQINPHFLYNTLDTIIWLIETGHSGDAETMVASLSAFFRTSLSKGRDIITLAEEENHVRSYMEIQQMRYRDILSYEISIAPELADCKLPKLTLQPLVENSLYHGIKCKRGQGLIRVRGRAEAGDILLTVEDNGAGMTPERLASVRRALENRETVGFGLATVHERIRLLFGRTYGLTVESNADGTAVTVRLPQCKNVAGPLEGEKQL